MHQVLFISRHASAHSLAEQAAVVFTALGIEQHEERFSANYPPDEHYFLGHAANLAVTVCDADDSEFPEYVYWAVLEEPMPWGKGTMQLSMEPDLIAEALACAGLNVFIPSDGWGRIDWTPSGKTFKQA